MEAIAVWKENTREGAGKNRLLQVSGVCLGAESAGSILLGWMLPAGLEYLLVLALHIVCDIRWRWCMLCRGLCG